MNIHKKLICFLNQLKILEERNQKNLICVKCLSKVTLKSKIGRIYRCRKKNCRFQFSSLNSILLINRKTSPDEIFTIIFYWLNNINISIISIFTQISEKSVRKTIWLFTSIYREKFDSESFKLGGIDVIVECDESKFGKKKKNKGKIIDGVWVFGMVERSNSRKIYLSKIKTKKSNELLPIIYKKAFYGTSLYTDCFQSYCSIDNSIYYHENVNHSENFVDPFTGVHTQTIEANWSAIKRNTPKEARCEDKIDIYLVRFMVIRNFGDQLYNQILMDTFY
ncbi:hypothetical protein DMUE_5241 [Dictyocoela muelleri]|nr:hypothetical protein DMUE_5241 [Dictyocoela muelleri]